MSDPSLSGAAGGLIDANDPDVEMIGAARPSPADMGVAIPDTRLHPVYLVIETARSLRSAIPFLVVTILGGAPWWVNAALFVIVMVVAVAQWHVKQYSVISGVLRLRTGVVNRMVRVLPITRITALDAYRSLAQRLVGVWGLKVQSPGDRRGSAIVLGSLSGRRLDQLQAVLDVQLTQSPPTTPPPAGVKSGSAAQPLSPATTGQKEREASALRRYLAWRRSVSTAMSKKSPDVVAVLRTRELLFAAVTNNTIPLIFGVAVVVWYQFSAFVPDRAADFMHESVEPRGTVAVIVALVIIAVVLGVVNSALRLNQFTLTRDGDVLRKSAGLLGTQSGTIPVKRVQAVRIVEGLWRAPFGYCSLQVEVAGIGVANTSRRTLFPLIKTAEARALISRALPEMHWPAAPLQKLPEKVHRRYLTVPMEYGAGFTVLLLFLPGWWRLLAIAPLPLAYLLGVVRAREAAWQLDNKAVVLRWRRILTRNMVVAHCTGAQRTEWASSPWKAKAGVAGFTMYFSSGRRARIRYMLEQDAILLLRVVGRLPPLPASPARPIPRPEPDSPYPPASTVDRDACLPLPPPPVVPRRAYRPDACPAFAPHEGSSGGCRGAGPDRRLRGLLQRGAQFHGAAVTDGPCGPAGRDLPRPLQFRAADDTVR